MTFDLVRPDSALPFLDQNSIDEGLSLFLFHVWVLLGLDQNGAVLVAQPPIAFHDASRSLPVRQYEVLTGR